jgi:two-component system sensor histidine kinase UhpB
MLVLAQSGGLAPGHAWLRADESAADARSLHAALVAAVEAERARIARDLHDVVGQALTAVRLSVLTLDERTGAGGSGVERSLATIDEALRQVRTAAFELRPAMLDDLGLRAALQSLCRRVEQQAGIEVASRISIGGARFAPEVETTCFRIAQEALTNVVRHAGARHVVLRLGLRRRTGALVLEIRDDGVGFDPSRCSSSECLGIAGMAERAALAGGSVEVRSSPSGGTQVITRLAAAPLRAAGR